MRYEVTTAPTVEPVAVEEAKEHLRLTHDEHDKYISELVRAAREEMERYTGRAFLQQTITLWLDASDLKGYGDGVIWLPKPPFLAITSVTGYDDDDDAALVPTGNYYTVGTDPAKLFEDLDTTGFAAADRRRDALKVVYTAGYGTVRSSVPWPLRQAIRVRVADLYYGGTSALQGTVRSGPLPGNWQELAVGFRYGYLC